MEAERWQQIESVLQLALDCLPENRRALLDSACAADAELRQEVESLLAAYEKSGSTEAAAFQDGVIVLEHRAGQLMTGRRVGRYRIIRAVGRGGMGTVYLGARADEVFQKFVAIKVLQRGLDTEELIQRFRTERQILATLDHPNIARLLDGGTTEDGLPYFVMEYIDGEPIDQFCDARKLNITERLKLFQCVCAAVRYAHQNLVVHRDIKPSNVLVTKEGVPQLLDFGIAKILSPAGSSPDATVTTLRPLTPEFASPEQIRGEPITTASDVYALGVLLYVLLAGRGPYGAAATTAAEIEAAICREEPQKPSVAACMTEVMTESVSATREGNPEKLRRRLQGDLDNIVLMALRKEPQRRYASVEQLSEDISRHLGALPVIARPDTRRYRAAKFIQRHKAGLAATASIFLVLIAGIVATLWQTHIARQERDRARIEQAKAARINAFLQEVVGYSAVSPGSPNRPKGHDATIADMLDDAARRVETELDNQPEVKANLLSTIGNAYDINARYDLGQRYLREAYDLYVKLAPDSVSMGEVMHRLANHGYLTGNYAEAESWIRQCLLIYRKHANDPGFETRRIAGALSDGAFINRALGRLDQAEAMWRESLSYGPRLEAKYRFIAIVPKTYLAQLYMDRGDLAKADPLASEAVQELRAGGFVFQLPQALIDLGNVRRFEGRYTESEALIQEGTELYARAQGDDNPNVAFGLLSLAMTHYYERRYDLAEQDAQRALKIVEKVPHGSHFVVAIYTPLALALNKTGRSREAERLFREVLAMREQSAPRRSNLVAAALERLGECLTEQGRYAEAEPLLTESYETLKSIHVLQSPVLREAAQHLTDLYSRWGKPQEAARYQVTTLASGSK